MADNRLTDDKLKAWEDILKAEKEEALKLIRSIDESQKKGAKESSGDMSSYSLHQADQGSDTDNMERQAYLMEKQQEKIKKLNAGLKRIYEKTYGICEICGCDIPHKRLKIVPYARFCIDCKSKEEKRNR